jgi:ethylbenzene dioxygenase alpha subunit
MFWAEAAMTGLAGQVADLVDVERGIIDRRIFWDRELYDAELARVFARSWLFVAHESQLPNPGDYVTTSMAEDAVIVARDDAGDVNVFLNSCPHRGNRVCFADSGNGRRFTCNYHGWQFGLNGDLKTMPKIGLYRDTPGFDFAEWGLKRARVESYKGLLFATFDPDLPALDVWLGDFRWYMDAFLDVEEGGTEFLPGPATRSVIACNWKFPADNFVGDIYHALWTHLGSIEPGLGGPGKVDLSNENSWQVSVNGHGFEFNDSFTGNAIGMGDRDILRYMRSRQESIAARLGAFRSKLWGTSGSANIFPNFAFLPGYFTFRTFQPRGPLETEIHAWTLVPKSMPEAMKDRIRRGSLRTFSPGGLFEMDDGENWEHSTRANAGYVTRTQKLCYSLAPPGEVGEAGLPGTLSKGQLNDANQRAFYRRWLEMMQAQSSRDLQFATPGNLTQGAAA